MPSKTACWAFGLVSLTQTVSRLREKLRHLEIETEAQILHRFQRDTAQEAADHAEFDPLELDRFSTLQQLSRSLAETVNDLSSLRTLLSDLQRDSDALLQQQARIADDLQDGLLRTRMVPFAQVVPRLHRLVRQTASQTGREARLEVFGPEVELTAVSRSGSSRPWSTSCATPSRTVSRRLRTASRRGSPLLG